jgi:pimeloyl-ACP methyl ester carboxylesterase
MKTRLVVATVVISALLSLQSLLSVAQRAARNQAYPPPGKLVDVGGYRLHLNTTGQGTPTVVLIAGAGDFSLDWSLVQPAISKFTRVCSYDRAGLAWSDLGPTPRTMHQDAAELHTLLKHARLKAPYVLVGHSLGGLIARIFAAQYPQEVAGLVLVDSTTENTTLNYQGKLVRVRESAKGRLIPPVQTMASSPPRPPTADDHKQAEFNRQVFGSPKIEAPFDKLPLRAQRMRLWALNNPKLSAATDDYFPEELQAMYVTRARTHNPLGNIPLIVLIAGKAEKPSDSSTEEWNRLVKEKREQEMELANLSTNSKVIIAEKSGHHIQLDEPQLVVDAIRRVIESVRGRTLPPAQTSITPEATVRSFYK